MRWSIQQHVLILGLLALTACIFAPAVGSHFLGYDDNLNVYENPHYQPVSLSNTRFFWSNRYLDTYRPVTYSIWAGLAAIAELPEPRPVPGGKTSVLDPRVFHLFNVLLHLGNVWLVYALLLALVPGRLASIAGATLFALHPLQVEAVAWVTGINDLLHAFWSLLALYSYLKFCRNKQVGKQVAPRASRTLAAPYIIATVCFGLALLSKPSAVAVPLMAAALDFRVVGRSAREIAVSLAPWVAIALAWVVVSQGEAPTDALALVPPWSRPFIALDAIGFYLSKLAIPLGLVPDYGRAPRLILEARDFRFALVAIGAALALWRWRRTSPGLVTGALIFLAALSPVLGLLPFRFQSYSTVADRYVYFPMLGISLALASYVSGWRPRLASKPSMRKFGLVAGAGVVIVLGARSRSQLLPWNNTFDFWNHTLRVNPRSWLAHDNLGMAFVSQKKHGEAAEHFEQAISINPQHNNARNSLGVARDNQGRYAEAIEHFERAALIDPLDPRPHFNLGVTLSKLGRDAEAIESYRQGLRLDPEKADAHSALALALSRTGDLAQAEAHFLIAARLDPSSGLTFMNWGLALARQNRLEAAIEKYEQALRLAPQNARVHYNLAVALARRGDPQGASVHWSEAIRLDPDFAEAHANLGASRLAQGDTDAARAHFERALQLNPALAPVRRALDQLQGPPK